MKNVNKMPEVGTLEMIVVIFMVIILCSCFHWFFIKCC